MVRGDAPLLDRGSLGLSGRIHFSAAEGPGVDAPYFGAAQCRGPRRYLDPGRNRSEAQTVAVSALFTTLSQSPETINWSARIGASVVTLAADLDTVRWVFQTYLDEAAKHGRKLRSGEYSTRGGVVLCRNVAVGRTHEEAMETARQGSAFWTHWLGEFGFFEALRMKGQEGPVPKTFEQMLKSGMQIVGTPDEVGEEIQRLKDTLNVDYIIFIMYAGMTEHKRMMESIRLFGEKVIPRFADAKVPEAKRAKHGVPAAGG